MHLFNNCFQIFQLDHVRKSLGTPAWIYLEGFDFPVKRFGCIILFLAAGNLKIIYKPKKIVAIGGGLKQKAASHLLNLGL